MANSTRNRRFTRSASAWRCRHEVKCQGARMKLFILTFLNGLTLASLYFLVASGFSLVFGLMRNVNLAHGSLYLLGAYVGWVVGDRTGSWVLAVAAGFLAAALIGLVMQVGVFRYMHGEDLRQ